MVIFSPLYLTASSSESSRITKVLSAQAEMMVSMSNSDLSSYTEFGKLAEVLNW